MGAAAYEVVTRGRLGTALAQSFEGLEVSTCEPDEMHLRGWFADQAALQGLLAALSELGIELAAVRRLPDAVWPRP